VKEYYWLSGRGDSNHEVLADRLEVLREFGHNDEEIEMLRKEGILIEKES
jgi:hypothetical protein